MKNPIHHIIPRYKCKELGIDPDFLENLVEVTREDHALIHWGYKCDDLEPLFEYVTPAQWIIDLIPVGDKRDMWAAQVTARGEIDGIDISGDNNSFYGKKHTEERKKKQSEMQKQYYIDNPDKKPFGEKNGMYGKTHTPENIEIFRQRGLDLVNNNLLYYTDENGDRVRRSFKGKNNPRYGATITDETKANISEGNKKFYRDNPDKIRRGENNPMYGKTGKNSPNYGQKRTPEQRKRMSELAKKRGPRPPMSDETKRKISESKRGDNNPMSRTNIERRAREKTERQGEGTLKAFLG